MDSKVLTDRVDYVIVNLKQTLHPHLEELDIVGDLLSNRVLALRMGYQYRGVKRQTNLYISPTMYPSDEELYLEAFKRAEHRTKDTTNHVNYMFDNGYWIK